MQAPDPAVAAPEGAVVKPEAVATLANGVEGASSETGAAPGGADDAAGGLSLGGGAPGPPALMSNGAPVLIKQDQWALPSPSMVPVSARSGRHGVFARRPLQARVCKPCRALRRLLLACPCMPRTWPCVQSALPDPCRTLPLVCL